jgi:prepilin-type N-terminal cleavage/methylation domain-containing protein
MRTLYQRSANGFSILELLFVVAIIGVLSTFALIGISRTRTVVHLNNNAHILQSYLQRVFSDARRRHALGGSRAIVEVIGPSAFRVTADLDGDGNPENRTISLTDNVIFLYDTSNPPRATVDWRGTVAEGTVIFNLRSPRNESLTMTLTSAGDSSIDGEAPPLPVIDITTSSEDVKVSSVVNGNSAPNPNMSPTPDPTPLPFCSIGQLPINTDCRCRAGEVIDKDGKCKN